MTDQSWTVRVDWVDPQELAEAKLDDWMTELAAYSPAVGLEPTGGTVRGRAGREYDGALVSVTVTVKAGTVRKAIDATVRLVQAVTDSKAIGVEALTTEEFDRRLNEPQIPPLIGQAEMATKLGVSRQRMAQLVERHDFPPEVVRTLAGPLFIEAQFEAWAQSWERRNGRPPKTREVV